MRRGRSASSTAGMILTRLRCSRTEMRRRQPSTPLAATCNSLSVFADQPYIGGAGRGVNAGSGIVSPPRWRNGIGCLSGLHGNRILEGARVTCQLAACVNSDELAARGAVEDSNQVSLLVKSHGRIVVILARPS